MFNWSEGNVKCNYKFCHIFETVDISNKLRSSISTQIIIYLEWKVNSDCDR